MALSYVSLKFGFIFERLFYSLKKCIDMKNLVLFLFLMPLFAWANPLDSIGVEEKGGVVYVVHKIERGETLYGIARKYKASAQEIINANPGAEKGIQADAKLLIPTRRTMAAQPRPVAPPQRTDTEPEKKQDNTLQRPSPTQEELRAGNVTDETLYHEVEAGETLFRIASQYNISVSDLIKWNQIQGEVIQVGQRLAVSKPSASMAIESQKSKSGEQDNKAPTTVSAPKKADNTPKTEKAKEIEKTQGALTNAQVVKSQNRVEGNPADEASINVPSRQVRTLGDEIVETGKITISNEGDLAQERNFILHPSAQIGTIVMITNLENGKSAFARVVGNYKAPAEQVAQINATLSKKLSIESGVNRVRVNYAR